MTATVDLAQIMKAYESLANTTVLETETTNDTTVETLSESELVAAYKERYGWDAPADLPPMDTTVDERGIRSTTGANMQPQRWHGPELLTEGHFVPVTNANFVKPHGGIWTCSYRGENSPTSWEHFCGTDYTSQLVNHTHTVALQPNPDARILVIDTQEDLVNIRAAYPPAKRDLHPDTPDWMVESLGGPFNFEAVSKDYDAIHLTDNGQWATRRSNAVNLYGWDVESTVWLRWDAFTID